MRTQGWTVDKLRSLEPELRAKLRDSLGRQRASSDPKARRAAGDAIKILDEVEVEGREDRVKGAREFLYGSPDQGAAQRLADARAFLRR